MTQAAVVLVFLLGVTDYGIVLDNGRLLRVTGPPERHGALVIGTLPDGTLVSLPEERVDWAATQKANELAPRADADRTRERVPVRRRVITNRTIDAHARQLPATSVPETGREASLTELPGPAVKVEPVRPLPLLDDDGRGPAYWRARARTAEHEVRAATRALEAAERALLEEEDTLLHGRTVTNRASTLTVIQYPQTDEELGAHARRLSELRERMLLAEGALEEARQVVADLREEARLAGADPGWVRLPVAYRP